MGQLQAQDWSKWSLSSSSPNVFQNCSQKVAMTVSQASFLNEHFHKCQYEILALSDDTSIWSPMVHCLSYRLPLWENFAKILKSFCSQRSLSAQGGVGSPLCRAHCEGWSLRGVELIGCSRRCCKSLPVGSKPELFLTILILSSWSKLSSASALSKHQHQQNQGHLVVNDSINWDCDRVPSVKWIDIHIQCIFSGWYFAFQWCFDILSLKEHFCYFVELASLFVCFILTWWESPVGAHQRLRSSDQRTWILIRLIFNKVVICSNKILILLIPTQQLYPLLKMISLSNVICVVLQKISYKYLVWKIFSGVTTWG